MGRTRTAAKRQRQQRWATVTPRARRRHRAGDQATKDAAAEAWLRRQLEALGEKEGGA